MTYEEVHEEEVSINAKREAFEAASAEATRLGIASDRADRAYEKAQLVLANAESDYKLALGGRVRRQEGVK